MKQRHDVCVTTQGLLSNLTSAGTIITGTSNTVSGIGTSTLTFTTGQGLTIPASNFSGATTSIGYVHNSLPTAFPTYNDFWKFDEEFDLLWKSFFDKESSYRPVKEKAVNHPCDIQETDAGLRIEVAAVGLDKSEIDIIVDSETLRIAYRKTEDDKQKEKNEYRYLHRSIKKASFDIAWKISSKYNLLELEAQLEKGLLILDIPFAKENKPKKVMIK